MTPRLRFFLPVVLFAGVALALAVGLSLDPRELPSTMIDKPAPEFDLPAVRGRSRGLASSDLVGEVHLVNFFASWCAACRVEHPLLNRLTEDGVVAVFGVNYKDKPEDARRWLDQLGDPYVRSGADIPGRAGIDWGVYGLPETFIVDANGHIVYKHVGAIYPQDLENTILPIVESLRQ